MLVSLEYIGVDFPYRTKQNIKSSLLPDLHYILDVTVFSHAPWVTLVYASHGKVSPNSSMLIPKN